MVVFSFLAVLLLVFLGITISIVALTAIFRRLNRWNRVYDGVNQRLKGQLYRGFLVSAPRLWFNYGQYPVRIQNRRGLKPGGKRTTELAIRWPDKRGLRFELVAAAPSEGVANLMGSGRNWQPAPTGDAEFDRRFVWWSNRPQDFLEILTAPVQSHLRQMADQGTPSLFVGLKRGTLVFRKRGWMGTVDQLDDFLRLGLETFDRMRLARCEGLQFHDEGEATIVEAAVCPICTETIAGRMVVCYRCKTPHCADCWEYNGQCATYGCAEKRCLSA